MGEFLSKTPREIEAYGAVGDECGSDAVEVSLDTEIEASRSASCPYWHPPAGNQRPLFAWYKRRVTSDESGVLQRAMELRTGKPEV